MNRARLGALVRLTRRDLARHRASTGLAIGVIALAGIVWTMTALGLASQLAARPGTDAATDSAAFAVDRHVVTFFEIIAVLGGGLAVAVTAAVFLTSFRRRLQEFGRLAALGARRGDTLVGALLPAAMIGLAAAGLGTPLGFWLAAMVGLIGGELGAGAVAVAAGTAVATVVACLVAAAYPAFRAWRLGPLGAIRRPPSRLGTVPRWVLALGVGVGIGGGCWAVQGAAVADVPSTLVGIALAGTGLAALIAFAFAGLANLPAGRFFSVRYALRDSARHPIRIVPSVVACAGVVAGVIAGAAYIQSSHQAAAAQHKPVAPMGSIFVPDATPKEASAIVAGAAPVRRAVAVQTVRGFIPSSLREDGAMTFLALPGGSLLSASGPLIATPEIADVFDLPAAVREAVAAGRLVLRESLAHLVAPDGTIAVHYTDPADPGHSREAAIPASAVLGPGMPSEAMLSGELAAALGLSPELAGVIVTAERPLTSADEVMLRGGWGAIETGPFAFDDGPVHYGLLAGAAVVAVMIVGLLMALTREESRVDDATLDAVGAPRSFTRRRAAAQTFVATALACAAGIPAGLTLARIFLNLTAADVAAGAAAAPEPVALTVLPAELAALAASLPALATAVIALTAPRLPLRRREHEFAAGQVQAAGAARRSARAG